jgi:predicted DNA-binding protein
MPLTVRIDPQLARRLDRAASLRGVTRSELVRNAVEKALAEAEGLRSLSFYDEVAEFVGCVDSGGQDLSQRTGERFRRLLESRRAADPR